MNHDRYHAVDPLDPRFEATAYVSAGELLFDIRVELESGERSISLRGPDQLRKIPAYFAHRYDSLWVCWSSGDNLKAFKRAIAAGATNEEAVLRTATGHQLVLAGYSNVAIQ